MRGEAAEEIAGGGVLVGVIGGHARGGRRGRGEVQSAVELVGGHFVGGIEVGGCGIVKVRFWGSYRNVRCYRVG